MSDATRTNEFDGETEDSLSQVERAVRFLTAEGPVAGVDVQTVIENYGLDFEELSAFNEREIPVAAAFLLGWVAKTHESDAEVPEVDPDPEIVGARNPIEDIVSALLGGDPAPAAA